MECPVCKTTTRVEIDTHSDGFAQNLQECGQCGVLWTRKGTTAIILHTSPPKAVVNQ